MSPDGCPGYPDTGVHSISTSNESVGVQQVGPVINVVVNGVNTPFYFRWLRSNPCTYEINLGTSQNSQWVRDDNGWINIYNGQYQRWILRKVYGDVYNIVLEADQNLVLTDPGSGGPAHRQLQLRPFEGTRQQQFRIPN